MNKTFTTHVICRPNKQSGATLIVSLIILAVITLLGLASMRSSNLELRMAASARDRAVAFQRAESALLTIERILAAAPYAPRSFDSNCTGNQCFTADCTGGLCFSGEFNSLGSRKQCKLADSTAVEAQPWKDDEVWEESDRHLQLQNMAATDGSTTTPAVKYIVEFLCFVPSGDSEISGVVGGTPTESETDLPLYRITVQAVGEAGRANVVLQSVLRASI
jgi:type IV pilus assembly protein PilX